MTRRSEDIAVDLSLLGEKLDGLPPSVRKVMQEGAERLIEIQVRIDRVVVEADKRDADDPLSIGLGRAAWLLDDEQQKGLDNG